MRFLNLSTTGIMRARKVVLPSGGKSLLSTEGAPLIADVSRGGQQILMVTFDIAESDWPWRLSFPLFIQNVVNWTPKSAMAEEKSVETGSPITLMPLSPESEVAIVKNPDGSQKTVNLDAVRPTSYSGTAYAGPYQITQGDIVQSYAVNLLDKTESAITPAANLSLGRGKVEAVRSRIKQNRELWRWFVLVVLMILAVEWWIYSRRAWI